MLCFIDRMAERLEGLAIELLQIIEQGMYLPPPAPDDCGGEEAEEWDQRALRDFLHGLSLVMHRFRAHLVGGVRREMLSGVAVVAGELLERSLWEGALLLMLRKRFPELFSPHEEDDPDDLRPRRLRVERLDAICAWIDVLVGQWHHLASQRKKWKTGDLTQTHAHLTRALSSLVTVRNLTGRAVNVPVAERARPRPRRRTSKLARPAAEHMVLHTPEPGGDTVVTGAKHIPAFTNLTLATMWRIGANPLPDELESLPDDAREVYAEHKIRLPDEPMNWLWWIDPDEESEAEEPF